ncbi:RNA methyltransferase [Gillisia sp. M10.2A]|uniref:tRNA (guanosine(18)-2'-O)-methyltransferase n=1 Tax=Gillisia lutea TaxID=2909668 RepID=A0ABS9EKB8_9FLAO|nr:RNA methyltransferase [Gillisia lutea]MCF4102772.1 RNA methyltransferase [Gillisia lutea]
MASPQFITFLEDMLTPERKALFEKVLNERTNHITVATEDVYQLHNTSAVIRSCDVFGVQNVHVIEEKNQKKIDREIAMGAQKWVSLNRHDSTADCITDLREKGYKIVATTPHDGAEVLTNFDITEPCAIFFGTEKDGLSDEVLSKADAFLKIPMYGFTESLNISVSAAIILQQLTGKLRSSSVDWKLSETDKIETKFEWLSKSFKNFNQLVKKFHDIY